MATTSLKKRVARLARTTKAKFSSLIPFHKTRKVEGRGSPRLVAFWHAVLRLDSMAARLKRIETGWNQHVPALLDSVSLALGEARAAGQVHDRIDAVREEMDRLALRLDLTLADFGTRLATAERPKGLSDRGVVGAVVGAFETKVERLDLRLARRRSLSADQITLTLAGATVPELTLDAAAELPFGSEAVHSILIATDFLLPAGGDLDATFLSWFRYLEPGGACVVERFYVSDLLDDLADQQLEMTQARRIAASRTPSPPDVSTDDIVQAMKAGGYDPVEVVRSDHRDVIVRGTRPLSGPVG